VFSEWLKVQRVGATREKGLYLGTLGTVADAEAAGVSLAFDKWDTTVLDSQGVIQMIHELMYQARRSCIAEKLMRRRVERP